MKYYRTHPLLLLVLVFFIPANGAVPLIYGMRSNNLFNQIADRMAVIVLCCVKS
jgi:hypothetical protein